MSQRTRLDITVFLALCALCLVMCGCQQFPKDSYAQGVTSTVNTPWGPSTFKADILATGNAAKNASLPDVTPVTPAPVKKK